MALVIGNPYADQGSKRKFHNFDIGFKPEVAIDAEGNPVSSKNGPVLTCARMYDAEAKKSVARQVSFNGFLEKAEIKTVQSKTGGPDSYFLQVHLGDDSDVCVASIPAGSATEEDGVASVGYSAAKLVGLLNRVAAEHRGQAVKIEPAAVAAGTKLANGNVVEKTIPSIRVSVETAPNAWVRVTSPLYAGGADALPETPDQVNQKGKPIIGQDGKPVKDREDFNRAATATVSEFIARANGTHVEADVIDEVVDDAEYETQR